jgi:pimeloyl-ACP methyl ester carboxylesterase
MSSLNKSTMKTKIILLLTVLNACMQSQGEVKPTFYIKHDDATMPVVVRGDIPSNVLILFLHGGPGGTALKKIGTRAFNSLEKEFGVVYWDQRGADASRGGTNKKYMNLDQFIEDMDRVIDQLNALYPTSEIFLMGHCWGGGLGTAYLIDKNRQAKITGWIDVAGAHNNPKGDSLSALWVKDYAHKKIATKQDTRYWKKALNWYEKNPCFTSADLGHYSFVRKAHGYQKTEGDSLGLFPCYTKKDLFLNPAQYVSYYANYYKTLSRFIISDINLTNQMYNITLPSLIIWGEEDGLIPVEMATEAYEALGTNSEDKYLITFKRTAHTVYYEQPDQFTKNVKEFINKYTNKKSTLLARALKN